MSITCTRVVTYAALLALIVTGAATAQSSGDRFTLRKSVIGAGAVVQGGPYRLVGTLGQASAGVAVTGSYRLTGGFHQGRLIEPGAVFCDGFEDIACLSGASR